MKDISKLILIMPMLISTLLLGCETTTEQINNQDKAEKLTSNNRNDGLDPKWETIVRNLPDGTSIIKGKWYESPDVRYKSEFATLRITKSDDPRFDHILQYDVHKRPRRTYMVQLVLPTSAEVTKGDTLLLTFYARCLSTVNESGYGSLFSSIGQNQKPMYFAFNKSTENLTDKWTKIYLPAVVNRTLKNKKNYKPDQARVSFNFGFDPQKIEIANIKAVNLGGGIDFTIFPKKVYTYEGRELDAPWRKDAAKRIDKYRKANLKIVANKADGTPASGIKFEVKMQNHVFKWGAAFNAEWHGRNINNTQGKKYASEFLKHFNTASHIGILKWPHWVDDDNKNVAKENIKWLNDNNMAVRGHTLVWPRWDRTPYYHDKEFQQKMEADPKAMQKMFLDHIREQLGSLKGQCTEWDVYNEPYSHYKLLNMIGWDGMVEWYKVAHEVDPETLLCINEGGHLSQGNINAPMTKYYIKIIDYLMKHKAPVHKIGFESHFGYKVPGPQKVYDMMDHFHKRYNLPLGITEFDQVVDDLELQGDWQRDFMIICFSHPAVTEFLMWGFWNGISSRGFYNKDWSLKPNGKMWLELVKKQWWTDEKVVSDNDGIAKVRGFMGDYTINYTVNGIKKSKKVKLDKGGKLLQIVID